MDNARETFIIKSARRIVSPKMQCRITLITTPVDERTVMTPASEENTHAQPQGRLALGWLAKAAG